MDNRDARREAKRRLRELLKQTGNSYRSTPTGYEVRFGGTYRGWVFDLHLDNGWLQLWGYVMNLPQESGGRAKLLECLAALSGQVSLVKFTIASDMVIVELQYRDEHLDGTVLGNLLGLIHSTCECHYPRLFRLVSGDGNLKVLEEAFQRPSLFGGLE